MKLACQDVVFCDGGSGGGGGGGGGGSEQHFPPKSCFGGREGGKGGGDEIFSFSSSYSSLSLIFLMLATGNGHFLQTFQTSYRFKKETNVDLK